MASSKVMKSSTSRNSDLSRRSSSTKPHQQQHLLSDHNTNKTEPSRFITSAMTVDGILRNVYNATTASSAPDATLLDAQITLIDTQSNIYHPASQSRNTDVLGSTMGVPKTVDEVWREIVSGESQKKEMKEEAAEDEMMTLEDFLAKAGAVDEAVVKELPMAVTERLSGSGVYAFVPALPESPVQVEGGSIMGFGNGVDRVSGRGKRGRVMLEPLDKAAQQRQRRMIKNRESAARSRERKQAYQVELESLAVKLEEENELLMKEKAERTRERYKQLMEKVIPVGEKQGQGRVLRRVQSMQW
ncbi:hypothetical protein LWI28_013720 [Acer negundo]|uniref:BZIP domain-containing protein n=1 Tax=Acer negundo TaxID=4023 RepID=A0AAD5P595_ACENE|nr:hypothetical protein LWI28_013720 [Acer negundo]KAK4859320.1 hypothetical protein QYF36_003487 [Acer negundo]